VWAKSVTLDGGTKKDEQKVDENRRNFLKATVVASAALAVGGMAAVAKVVNETGGDTVSTTQTGFPTFLIADVNSGQVANVNSIQVNQPLTYYYPLDNESNIIVKLGVAVEDGVGPDGDIVSYSDICQHLGCNPGFVQGGGSPPCNSSYVAKGPVMYCCCHGSIYDLENDATVIGGPAPRPVPRVILKVDTATGDIYATGMAPPTIYNHGSAGSDDVSADLQDGTLVSSVSVSS
jgi:arsenite oxidase small subunit